MNTFKQIVSILALSATFIAPVYADVPARFNWKDIGMTKINGEPIYIDTRNLEREGNLVSLWLSSAEDKDASVMHYSVDCLTHYYVLNEAWIRDSVLKGGGPAEPADKGSALAETPFVNTAITAACAATAPTAAQKRKVIPYHAPQIILR